MLLYNPAAGRHFTARAAGRLAQRFARLGWTVHPCPTEGPGTAAAIIRARAAEIDGVVVIGGDGTINECLPALLDTRLFLAILPGGTANVLALELGLPHRPAAAAAALTHGQVRPVTVGLANGRPFLAFLGIGFDAYVSQRVNLRLKHATGKTAYLVEALRQVGRYPFAEATFEWPGGPATRAPFAIFSNAARYGGSLRVAPDTHLETPDLQLNRFNGRSAGAYLNFLYQIIRGTPHRCPHLAIDRVTHCRVTADTPIPYQVDGEPAGCLPLEVEARPAALRLLFPGRRAR